MAAIEIALSNQDPAFSFDTILDKNQYEFDFRFNSRLNIWMVDILDAKSETIINSLPMYTNRNLAKSISNPRLPEGLIYVFSEGKLDADRFTFGKDVKLYYREA